MVYCADSKGYGRISTGSGEKGVIVWENQSKKDEDIDGQPELSYTREETRTLVHELIDSLSEEQRMCILMFHIDRKSVV